MRESITNEQYLEEYLMRAGDINSIDGPAPVILPHEVELINAAIAKQQGNYDNVIQQKMDVSGGDDWHDGAFRATDNEALVIAGQMRVIGPFVTAKIVGYPDVDEERVTLGSRLTIIQNGISYPTDVVGFLPGYPDNITDDILGEEVTAFSPKSPIAKAIMGSREGESGTFLNGQGDQVTVTIGRVDQLAVREYFMSLYPKLETGK